MNTINQFNRSTVNKFHKEFTQLAKQLAEKHGVELSKDRGSYQNSCLKLNLEFHVVNESGFSKKEVDNRNRYVPMYGMKKEWLRKTFVDKEKQMSIIGWDSRKQKIEIIRTRS